MNLQQVLAALVPLTFLITWLTDTVKDVTNKNWNSLLTKAVAVAAAFSVISLYAHGSLDVGGSLKYISTVPWQGLLLAALILAASGGTLADTLRAFNKSDASVKSTLLPPQQ